MSWSRSLALTSLAFAGACADSSIDPPLNNDPPPHPSLTDVVPPQAALPVSAVSCAPGGAAQTIALGTSGPQQRLSLAVDSSGATWVAGDRGVTGVTELTPSGAIVRHFVYGSLVAADAAGHVVIAGSFTAPIDLGVGQGVMTPAGNSDVFVVELDHRGQVVFARSLGLCGDGLNSLAIAGDGRIALSGSAMGTVILSDHGGLVAQLTAAGQVAFDLSGDLVIAGGDATTSAFLRIVDRGGATLAEHDFDGTGVLMTGVTVDAAGHIVFVGYTTDSIDLFGTVVAARLSIESGRATGAFLGEVDPDLQPLTTMDLQLVEANGVAAARDGTIYVAGAQLGNTGFHRLTEVGALAGGLLLPVNVDRDGRDLAVAVDACGAPVAGEIRGDADPTVAIQAVVSKLPRH